MILFITCLAVAGIIGYYFLMLKPKQHEKAKKETTGRTHQITDSRQYDEIINDYPTYHRQVK